MKKLHDYEKLCTKRSKLKEFLDKESEEVWLLNDVPVSPMAEQAGRRTVILLVTIQKRLASKPIRLLIVSTPGTKEKNDKYLCWEVDNLTVSELDPDNYILLDKSKMGKPPRRLTQEEKQRIYEMRIDKGMAINAIARELRVSNKTVMKYCKILSQEFMPSEKYVESGRKIFGMIEQGLSEQEICRHLHINKYQCRYFMDVCNLYK